MASYTSWKEFKENIDRVQPSFWRKLVWKWRNLWGYSVQHPHTFTFKRFHRHYFTKSNYHSTLPIQAFWNTDVYIASLMVVLLRKHATSGLWDAFTETGEEQTNEQYSARLNRLADELEHLVDPKVYWVEDGVAQRLRKAMHEVADLLPTLWF